MIFFIVYTTITFLILQKKIKKKISTDPKKFSLQKLQKNFQKSGVFSDFLEKKIVGNHSKPPILG